MVEIEGVEGYGVVVGVGEINGVVGVGGVVDKVGEGEVSVTGM